MKLFSLEDEIRSNFSEESELRIGIDNKYGDGKLVGTKTKQFESDDEALNYIRQKQEQEYKNTYVIDEVEH